MENFITESYQQDARPESEFLPSLESSGIISLDPDGDAILVVECHDSEELVQFRVSTKVLGLASPVFAKLFGKDFQEGQAITSQGSPHIKLEDDDSSAMEVILTVLHYRGVNQLPSPDAESLAALALHCDKYDCLNALSAWISHWFQTVTTSPEDLGFLLLAAYFFDNGNRFEDVSRRALRELTPGVTLTWRKSNMLSLLPDGIHSEISKNIRQLQRKMHRELESVEALLRENKMGYKMQCLICMRCGRTPPIGAKKCHPCQNDELHQKFCTYDFRVAEYFAALSREELWPTIIAFETCSVSDLAQRFTCARKDLKHDCAAGSRCPLERELEKLRVRVCSIEAGVKGFCLRCVKRSAASSGVGICDCT